MPVPDPLQPDLPQPEVPLPLRRVLPAARWEAVTHGQSGAQVWSSRRHVLKVAARQGLARPLHAELLRLRWLAGRLPVPEVVGYEVTPDTEYLAVTRLPGVPLHHPDALVHPLRVTELLARALRELHALPVRDCPFNASLAVTLRQAHEQVRAGLVDESDFDDERRDWTAVQVMNELLRTRPAHEDIVVTHGDPCLPNLLINGEYLSGFIDVGRLGLADRHADLALAHRDLTHTIGPDMAEHFLDVYGRGLVDARKLRYYALLDELF
ncbi:APH(3') family aminoglycoside O-phosphotransferase [Deinococcus sp.]|uniref:APH(3') family aminoglycoside O-phosphotransferase n=1 Tax=Deinococcus sp. TaxID=47478 RepID=UPI00286E38B4|nr:APH(3') family aminoglycoside O-phosphotransferase [Deinococcus sp.]